MVFVCFALKPLTNHTAYRIKFKLPAMPFRIPTTRALEFAFSRLFSTLHATNHSQVSLLLLLNSHPHWLLSQYFFSCHFPCLFPRSFLLLKYCSLFKPSSSPTPRELPDHPSPGRKAALWNSYGAYCLHHECGACTTWSWYLFFSGKCSSSHPGCKHPMSRKCTWLHAFL